MYKYRVEQQEKGYLKQITIALSNRISENLQNAHIYKLCIFHLTGISVIIQMGWVDKEFFLSISDT